jgi:hypothetical protein
MRRFYELLQEDEHGDISESECNSDSKINMKISSGGEQSVSSDETENISGNSSMQSDVWANSGAERSCFQFTGKPVINVDLEDPSNPLEYFELIFYTRYCGSNSQRNKSVYPKIFRKHAYLKLKSSAHHWKETNRIEMMKLLALFLLQGLHQQRVNKSYFCRRKILETPIYWTCSLRGGFSFY